MRRECQVLSRKWINATYEKDPEKPVAIVEKLEGSVITVHAELVKFTGEYDGTKANL